jgi:hypothetical protein
VTPTRFDTTYDSAVAALVAYETRLKHHIRVNCIAENELFWAFLRSFEWIVSSILNFL